jgi:hypothetical protein
MFLVVVSFQSDGRILQRDSSAIDGLSPEKLKVLADSLPSSSGPIQSIQFFRHLGGSLDGVAVLTLSQRIGWQIFIFNLPSASNPVLEWKSGKLDDSLQVSTSESLKVSHIGSGDIIEFSGCARHVCPDVFSAMFYAPLQKGPFMATSSYGITSYSPDAEVKRNPDYKRVLDAMIEARH